MVSPCIGAMPKLITGYKPSIYLVHAIINVEIWKLDIQYY
jgi:hypothetical protein